MGDLARWLSSLKGRDRSRGNLVFFVDCWDATDRRRGQWWSARSRRGRRGRTTLTTPVVDGAMMLSTTKPVGVSLRGIGVWEVQLQAGDAPVDAGRSRARVLGELMGNTRRVAEAIAAGARGAAPDVEGALFARRRRQERRRGSAVRRRAHALLRRSTRSDPAAVGQRPAEGLLGARAAHGSVGAHRGGRGRAGVARRPAHRARQACGRIRHAAGPAARGCRGTADRPGAAALYRGPSSVAVQDGQPAAHVARP